jgi:Xaa-Pro aminopeptidase
LTDVLLYADTLRSPELRHEVPLGIGDAFLYVERDGERHVVVGSIELPRLEGLDGYVVHPFEDYGFDELRRSGRPFGEVLDEVMLRAVRALGVQRAAVPPTFPLLLADRLRAEGVELEVDRGRFERRRRAKTGAELAGVRRAQAAAGAGMAAARALLRRSAAGADGVLELDGEPLTSERVKAAVGLAFLEHGAVWDEFVVSHGAQAAIGHHMGEGAFRTGETIVIDLWPRDAESFCCADMTRTFVVGEVPAEVAEWHRLCREALAGAIEAARPGVTGKSLFDAACDLFEAAGYPTQRTKAEGETLAEGFFHSLGHGVGLEVHEAPSLGQAGHEELVPGDVVALEPGLYRPDFGGCRLEDLVLVTDDGAENLTSFPYDLSP